VGVDEEGATDELAVPARELKAVAAASHRRRHRFEPDGERRSERRVTTLPSWAWSDLTVYLRASRRLWACMMR